MLLFSVAIFWGSNFVFIKDVVERTTELAAGSIVAGTMLYLVLRYVVATGIFAVVQPKSWLGSSRGDWARGGLLGAFYLTALILQTVGLQRTSPGVSGFITGMSVAMVPFLYWFVARRSPGRWQIIGAVVATIGLGALSLQGDFTLKWGDAITLLGTLFYALHIMTTGFFAPKVKPTTLAVTQMAVSDTCALVEIHRPVHGAHHPRPPVGGVGGRRVDGDQRHHLRLLHPELGAAVHDLDARGDPPRLRERVRRHRRYHRRHGQRDLAPARRRIAHAHRRVHRRAAAVRQGRGGRDRGGGRESTAAPPLPELIGSDRDRRDLADLPPTARRISRRHRTSSRSAATPSSR